MGSCFSGFGSRAECKGLKPKAGPPSAAGAWEPSSSDHVVDLLPSEVITLMLSPPINTVTFFEGDAAAAAALIRERVGKLLVANPWLAGRLHKAGGKVPLLCVPVSRPDPAHYVVEMPCPTMRPDMSPKAIEAEIQAVAVTTGNAALGKDVPLFRVGVLTQEEGHFAVVVSLNHVIGDGYTYYRLFGCLGQPPAGQEGDARSSLDRPSSSAGAGPGGLEPKRTPEYEAAKIAALGGEAKADWTNSLGCRLGIVAELVRSRPTTWSAWKVDGDWVAARKSEWSDGSYGGAPVSTNDVLTSWFLCRGAFDFGCMALNLRDRISGPTKNHAGNYVNPINFWPEEFATPACVRRSLLNPPHFNAGRLDSPGFLESLSVRFGIVTNWSSLQTHLVLPGCKQVLHLPIMLTEVIDGLMVIFQPLPGELAVIMGEKRPPSAHPEAGTSPLGARLC